VAVNSSSQQKLHALEILDHLLRVEATLLLDLQKSSVPLVLKNAFKSLMAKSNSLPTKTKAIQILLPYVIELKEKELVSICAIHLIIILSRLAIPLMICSYPIFPATLKIFNWEVARK
jgi:hypothetical protein